MNFFETNFVRIYFFAKTLLIINNKNNSSEKNKKNFFLIISFSAIEKEILLSTETRIPRVLIFYKY